jgi:hypothetical protein
MGRRAVEGMRRAVAAVGAAFIYGLIRLFGRGVRVRDVPWLVGPVGSDYIGDTPYEQWAEREGLHLVRKAEHGGLIPNFDVLHEGGFDVSEVDPLVRDFYEDTARYRMDVWAQTFFPSNVALWLLVTTISREVNQLNFPLRVLETAKGMDSGWTRSVCESGTSDHSRRSFGFTWTPRALCVVITGFVSWAYRSCTFIIASNVL